MGYSFYERMLQDSIDDVKIKNVWLKIQNVFPNYKSARNYALENNLLIDSFKDEYFFLSNYYESPVIFEGIEYKSSEAAFQAQKLPSELRKVFSQLTPSEAKHLGRIIKLPDDWDENKIKIMRDIVFSKFTQNKDLREKLLKTGDIFLEEGNTWGDRTWGTVNGYGENVLGFILMGVRDKLKEEE